MSAEAIRQAADAIESALADAVEQLGRTNDSLGLIETAMAEAIDRMGRRQAIDIGPLVAAITSLRPVVNVNVPPAPAPIVHVLPAAEFIVTLNDPYGNAERTMTIKRVAQAT